MKKKILLFPRQPNVVSLYSGWGGGDYGFHRAGYKTLLAVDFDKHARECFRLNFPRVDVKGWDISKLNGRLLLEYLKMLEREIDVLLMSPSCQGISKAGKEDPFDERNFLFLKSIKNIIPQAQPKTFIIENVDNLLYGRMRLFYDLVLEELESLTNYVFDAKVMNALHYNTPQCRDRLIIMGVHKSLGLDPVYPEPRTDGMDRLRIEKVLPEIDGLLYGYGFDKLKGRDEFANTITKTLNLYAKVGEEEVQLTIPQILKLSGYPRSWKYMGKYEQVWARLGNSIMPLLMNAIAKTMKQVYFSR